MSEVKMLTAPVPNVPWQERPQGPQNGAPIWRYSENPIIGRNPLKGVARIFNSAVMPARPASTFQAMPAVLPLSHADGLSVFKVRCWIWQ